MKQIPRLRIALQRSRSAVFLLALMAVATALLLWTLPWRWWLILLLDTALFLWMVFAIRRLKNNPTAITLWANGDIRIEYANAQEVEGLLADDCYINNLFVTIIWRTNKKRKQIFLLPDMMNAEEWRQLRVMLRFMRSAESEASN